MARAMRMREMFNAPGKYKSRGQLASDAALMAGMVMDGLIVVRLAREGMKEEARKVLEACRKYEGIFGQEKPDDEMVESTSTDGESFKEGRDNGDPERRED